MPYTSFPQTVQVDMVGSLNGQVVTNCLHFVGSQAPATQNMEDLAEALVTWWNTAVKNIITSTGSLTLVRVTDLTTQDAEVVSYQTGLPIAGTASGESLPNNVSLCFTKRTSQRGRSYRGRYYHWGMTEAHVTGNTVIPAIQSQMINSLNLLRSMEVGTDIWALVVASRFQNGSQIDPGIVTLVTGHTTDGVVDSQRRRLPGRGR